MPLRDIYVVGLEEFQRLESLGQDLRWDWRRGDRQNSSWQTSRRLDIRASHTGCDCLGSQRTLGYLVPFHILSDYGERSSVEFRHDVFLQACTEFVRVQTAE